ncbi:hypothetical protein [Iodobacter fluviatilis]|uniref:Uncharacterized protein n=1 Tax=Iodobacter fluviatilis TaxID=537 RepID=A0A377Q771_9NEIS|nr:hypothetical protein [Iodobacter fluviatilis]TCU89307.1 hypothetical protein EV682_102219 [Iodobacter fluviatilis]STQ90677.1 Uncharacterised protein [Iodobacter fluviatilis]
MIYLKNSNQEHLELWVKNARRRLTDSEYRVQIWQDGRFGMIDNKDFIEDVFCYLMSFDSVSLSVNNIGGVTESMAFYIFTAKKEFVCIDNKDGYNLRILLPYELGMSLVKKGWGEQSPLAVAGKISNTHFVLYGARSFLELNFHKKILQISYLFTKGEWKYL